MLNQKKSDKTRQKIAVFDLFKSIPSKSDKYPDHHEYQFVIAGKTGGNPGDRISQFYSRLVSKEHLA